MRDDEKNMSSPFSSQKLLFEHVFKELHGPLFFYALKFVKNEDVAKDMVQDAFLSILSTDTNIHNLKSFLFRSVRNNCLNFIKSNNLRNEFAAKEKERLLKEIDYYDSNKTFVENELHLKIKSAIDALPNNYRTVLKLSRFEELKNKEIAEKLNIPIRTVETRIYRALKMLRDKFKDKSVLLFTLIRNLKN